MRVSDLRALTNIERQMARRIRPKTADGAADWLEKKTGVKRPLEPNVDLYEDQPLLLTDLLLPFFFSSHQLRRQLCWDECAATSISLCVTISFLGGP